MPRVSTIIVVDPRLELPSWQTRLYGRESTVLRAETEFQLRELVHHHKAALVVISTLYKPSKCLSLLTALKEASATELLPLIYSLDLSEAHASFPLTEWANKFGLIHSQTSPAEWSATLTRLL